MTNAFTLDLPLAHIALDRDYLTRDQPLLFEELWKNEATLVLAMYRQQVLLVDEAELKFMRPEQISSWSELIYLGKTMDTSAPVVLAIIDEKIARSLEADVSRWHQLRKSGLGLSSKDAAIFTQALALANWHESHRFCSTCGSATFTERAGWVRRCIAEGREIFPRTDPAVIVGVIDDQNRILLGSQGAWEENRFSILAGFVEPGESLNAAVIREMREEAGIDVYEPEFLGSQAWPFPYSLMFGFLAKYKGGEAIPDGEEIVKLRWFSKEELQNEADSLLLPGKLSIARAIIEHWLGEPLGISE